MKRESKRIFAKNTARQAGLSKIDRLKENYYKKLLKEQESHSVKATCLSIDCPERKSVCCDSISRLESNMTPEHFVCSKCDRIFVGGKCKIGK